MKQLAAVKIWKLLKLSRSKQLTYIKSNLKDKELIDLLYIGYHTAIDFRFTLPEELPRPQLPIDNHKEFYRLAMSCIKDQFNIDKRKTLKEFIESTDDLSRYIYSKIINRSLGLSRNDLEEHIPGLIIKEPYEIVSTYGAPKIQ